jgi:hypothetical protein
MQDSKNNHAGQKPHAPGKASPILWIALCGFFVVVFLILSLVRLVISSGSDGDSSTSTPSSSYVETEATVSFQGSVEFEVKGYDGSADPTEAARKALKGINWADLSDLKVDVEGGVIVIGATARGNSFETAAAKSALEKAGFSIDRTSMIAE